MRILITGGFGFVGARLAAHLATRRHHIILGTRKLMNAPNWLPDAEVETINWENSKELEAICQKVDIVIHSAGINAKECLDSPVDALAFNGVSTTRLVGAAKEGGVSKFIYISTAHVYASPLVGNFTEESCPRNLHPYATSHLAGEYSVLNTNARQNFIGIVLRLSNTFGEPMHENINCWNLVVNDLCKQAVENRKMIIKTSMFQQRDFIGLDSVCQVVEHMAVNKFENNKNNIYNVGTGESNSIFQMSKLIQQRCDNIFGYKPEIEYKKEVNNKINYDLNYNINKIKSVGINVKNFNKIIEIDKILQYCNIAKL